MDMLVVGVWLAPWFLLSSVFVQRHGEFWTRLLFSFVAMTAGQLIFRIGERRRSVS
jgi:hypothetical protein